MDTVFRAGVHTRTAADTLWRVDVLGDLHAHLAGSFACLTVHALILVDRQTIQAELVEQCIECTERTQILTEWSVNERRQNDDHDQYKRIPFITKNAVLAAFFVFIFHSFVIFLTKRAVAYFVSYVNPNFNFVKSL